MTNPHPTVICAACLRPFAATADGRPVRHGWATNPTMSQHSKCIGSGYAPITESADGLRDAVAEAQRFLDTPPGFGEGRARRVTAEFIAAAPAVAAKYGHAW